LRDGGAGLGVSPSLSSLLLGVADIAADICPRSCYGSGELDGNIVVVR
jgi:hypothetical protein